PWPEPPESKESGRPPRVGEDGFLRYRLGWEPILAVKVIILRTYSAVRKRKAPNQAASPPGPSPSPGGVAV
ncbi:hypothetical protein THAOC_07487, partial [Thalassiosira oceanica]